MVGKYFKNVNEIKFAQKTDNYTAIFCPNAITANKTIKAFELCTNTGKILLSKTYCLTNRAYHISKHLILKAPRCEYSERLRPGRTKFDSRQVQENFLFSTASRPALELIHPLIQWIPGTLFLGGKAAGA
jgi:hypothetical protein